VTEKTEQTARHARAGRAGRSPWKPLAGAAIGVSVLAIAGQGVFAGLTASATNTTPQAVGTGGLTLTMTNTGVGLSQAVADLAPGDTVNRHVVLTNGGTIAAGDITFAVAGATGTLGADTTTTKGLRIRVSSCSVAWTASTGACSGTSAVVLASRTVAGLDTPVSLGLSGSPVYLQVSLNLPEQDETTTNGAAPATTIQNRNASLTYTFTTVQRAARTTNS
jgi:hypothetical protein